MGNDCLVVAVRLNTSRVLHLRTMTTVMEQHLIVECYGWVIDEEFFEGVKNSSAGCLLVCEQEDMILGNTKLVHEKNAHRLNVIDAAIEVSDTLGLVLVDADLQGPERWTDCDL